MSDCPKCHKPTMSPDERCDCRLTWQTLKSFNQNEEIEKLQKQNKILMEACEFYANRENYIELCVDGSTGNKRISDGDFVDCIIDHSDRGFMKARQAISEAKRIIENE